MAQPLDPCYKWLKCIYCGILPNRIPVFSCEEGHLACTNCYGVLNHQGSRQAKCKQCGKNVTENRNATIDHLIKELDSDAVNSEYNGDYLMNRMRPAKSILALNGISRRVGHLKCYKYYRSITPLQPNIFWLRCFIQIRDGSEIKMPHRPIRCPEMGCGRTIAMGSVTTHFLFEHSYIQQQITEPGVCRQFLIDSDALRTIDEPVLLGILQFANPNRQSNLYDPRDYLSKMSQTSIAPPNINKPIVIMCALLQIPTIPQLDLTNLEEGDGTSYMGSKNDECEIKPARSKSANKIDETYTLDLVVLWASGSEYENVSYKIQALDPKGNRVHSFEGPLKSLRESQDPVEIYGKGDCLTIQGGALEHLTQNWNAKFKVKVTIH